MQSESRLGNKTVFIPVLIIFLVTLQSFYFSAIKLAPFPLISLLILVFLSQYFLFKRDLNVITLSFLCLFLISSLCGFFMKLDFYYINSVLGALIGPIFFVLMVAYLKKIGKEKYEKTLKLVLTLHLIFFLIQFLSFFLLNVKIDYLGAITGEESRSDAYGAITNLIRCTGLFNEPATYSYYIFLIVYLRFLCDYTLKKLDHLGLLSILMTLSVSGFLLFAFFQFYYWVIIKRNTISILTFIILLLLVVFISNFYFQDTIQAYLLGRITGANDDVSANTRFSSGIDFFFTLPINYKLLGLGIGNYSNYTSTTASGIMSIFTTFGFINSLIIAFILSIYFYLIRLKLINLLPFLVLLLSTITPMMVVFWFILASMYNNKKNFSTTI